MIFAHSKLQPLLCICQTSFAVLNDLFIITNPKGTLDRDNNDCQNKFFRYSPREPLLAVLNNFETKRLGRY